MNKKNIKKIIIIAIFLFIGININNRVNATSINVTPSSPKVGDTVKITVSISNVNTADITANVSGAVSGTIKVVGGNVTQEPSNYSNSASFHCDKEGPINIAISDASTAVLNGNYVEVGASTSVTVTAPAANNTTPQQPATTTPTETKKSNNANLANLGITPNDFRGFKSGTLAYNVTVPNDVEQVNVYAKLQDSKAKITSGTGNQKLKVGKNELKVVVTAEDGTTTKTYTINVTREEEKVTTNETENNNTTDANQTTENEEKKDEKKKSDLIKLEIEGYTISPKFSPDVYEYKLDLKDNVDKLNVITEGANHNVNIEVAGNTELKDGENTITILVTNEETKETSTYQIMVNKQVTTNNETDESINRAIKKANKIRAIILGIIGFIIVAIIVFFIVRKNMYEEDFDEDDYDYDSEDKEKIDLNEEDELFKRVNKEIFEKKVKDDDLEIKYNYKMEIEDSNIEDIDKRARRYKEEEGTKREEEKQRIQEDEEEKREFFRTSKSKPKGKHF